MASATMTAGLKTSALVSSKVDAKSLKAAPVSQAFGVKNVCAKVSCSAEKSFVQKAVEGAKVAAVALASSALLASGAQAQAPRLSFDELQSKTYSEIKGTGIANQCPEVTTGDDGFKFPAGKYQASKFCLEPTSFTVKTEKTSRNGATSSEFTNTKLMTRLTYTLDEIEGPFTVGNDGKITFEEKDGIDYAAVTVQLPGGERVPFLFTVKELVASGPASNFGGEFTVPSYRGASFLDPKGRGGTTGYDNAVALPAGGAGDEEELAKENDKSYAALKGKISFTVTKSDVSTGEVQGTFVSIQPSDTDMGAKVPKDVKIEGIWYAQLD